MSIGVSFFVLEHVPQHARRQTLNPPPKLNVDGGTSRLHAVAFRSLKDTHLLLGLGTVDFCTLKNCCRKTGAAPSKTSSLLTRAEGQLQCDKCFSYDTTRAHRRIGILAARTDTALFGKSYAVYVLCKARAACCCFTSRTSWSFVLLATHAQISTLPGRANRRPPRAEVVPYSSDPVSHR